MRIMMQQLTCLPEEGARLYAAHRSLRHLKAVLIPAADGRLTYKLRCS